MKRVKCEYCGSEINASDKFCGNCGAPINIIPINNVPTNNAEPQKYPSGVLGFRTKTKWKKILSIAYLCLVGIIAIMTLFGGKVGQITTTDLMIDKLYAGIMILAMLSPYIFLSNTKLRDKLPLFKKHTIGSSIAGMVVVVVSLILVSSVVYNTHTPEYLADMENHAFTEKVTVVATCKTDGKVKKYCEYCGIEETITTKGTHTWDSGNTTIAATCTTDGTCLYTCTTCNTTKSEVLTALGHKWDSGNIMTAATCSTDGSSTYTCTTCNTTKTEVIKALGHKWNSGNIITAATCSTDGSSTYTCTTCNDTKTEVIAALGHKWEPSTCETPHICSVCGDTDGLPRGHLTDCGICSRCKKEIRKQSPVTILDWTYTIDYVGGVEWNFRIRNNTDKQIKYVTMQWSCYNAVGDLVYDQIDGKSYKRVRFTGPLDAYATSETKRNTDKFYNHNLKSYKMTEITVEYMDGTTEKVTNYHDNIIG